MNKVLVLGGYGNFGRRISMALAKAGIDTIIAGRQLHLAKALVNDIQQRCPNTSITAAQIDIHNKLEHRLKILKPHIVINTCGPFQGQNYAVARSCITQHIHYIDLADAREFVRDIATLDASAKAAGVSVISGASTVPGLSSAVIKHYQNQFQTIQSLQYGITPGQKAPRGLATSQSILSYLGKPIKTAANQHKTRFGWQDNYRQTYPQLGKRWMANCDIPDLDLFPDHYGITHIRFSAGMESSPLHLGMSLMSWLVRLRLPLHLAKHAKLLLRVSRYFDRFGSEDGGMHVQLQGVDTTGQAIKRQWFIVAKQGDGPQIPCIPAIVLTKKILAQSFVRLGAMPCVGLISLEEYLAALKGFAIEVYE